MAQTSLCTWQGVVSPYPQFHTHILDSEITKNGEYKKLHELLNDLMRLYDPSFSFTSIKLNNNVTLPTHHHPDNIGYSYGLALGQFEGGGLMVYDRQPECTSSRSSRNE
jgi:hypothetical protein